jgi:hypothetical protein
LSVTAADGTNYCASGSTEIATKEVDYFVYLGWNATGNNIMLGFSRIPYARRLDDFTYANTTSQKSIVATGTASSAVSDNFVNIGRFAATLSAGAGYTWTVPTFTTTNLIQVPIYQTRWLPCAASLTITNGPSSTTVDSQYQINDTVCNFKYDIKGTVSVANTAVDIYVSIPFSAFAITTAGTALNMGLGQNAMWTDNTSFSEYAKLIYINNVAGTFYINFPTATRKINEFALNATYRI